MSDFESYRVPRRKIPTDPAEAGLPSDEEVTASLRALVASAAARRSEADIAAAAANQVAEHGATPAVDPSAVGIPVEVAGLAIPSPDMRSVEG